MVFTFESTRDPGMRSPLLRPMRERFASMEARGDRQVRFHLVQPLATAMTDLDFGIVSSRAAGKVGIAVEVQSFEFPTVFTDYKQGNYQLGSLETATISEPDFLLAYFHSSRIPTADDPNALNRMRYASPRVDELTDLGRRRPGRLRARSDREPLGPGPGAQAALRRLRRRRRAARSSGAAAASWRPSARLWARGGPGAAHRPARR